VKTKLLSAGEAVAVPASTDRFGLLREFVAVRVSALQSAYLRGESGATGSLAILRRALGTDPGADPLVWQYTLGLPDALAGHDDDASPAERAVHYAITLFALHQQSQGAGMHRRGQSMGSSARQLGKATGNEDAVHRRFTALGTASSLAEASIHARGLISQFRASKIPLDYGLLSVDFFKLQDPRLADSVRLVWGRDYYRLSRVERGSLEDEGAEQSPEIQDEKGEIS
jgi:CRISPR system Cascade subunit CasB